MLNLKESRHSRKVETNEKIKSTVNENRGERQNQGQRTENIFNKFIEKKIYLNPEKEMSM